MTTQDQEREALRQGALLLEALATRRSWNGIPLKKITDIREAARSVIHHYPSEQYLMDIYDGGPSGAAGSGKEAP